MGLAPLCLPLAWRGQSIYDILIGRLTWLERTLVARGFDDPVQRIQFHIETMRQLRECPRIDSDRTLWSLVEATELADIYCGMPAMSHRTFRMKFQDILNGPFAPQDESSASNHSRNTVFELNLAGWLKHKGVLTEVSHNPDISCYRADRRVFIQCKRPFGKKNIETNIKRAKKQLHSDLDMAGDERNRGVVAISLTRALNPANMLFAVRTEKDLAASLHSQMHTLATKYTTSLISGPRIVGIVFQMTAPAFVEELNQYRMVQVVASYRTNNTSRSDIVLLRSLFRQK